jgi:uncharacterized protein (DUF433 family)
MLDWNSCPAVERNPERVSGAWVFKGTRVPVRALFENLEEGASVDDFLEWFPGVTREQVLTAESRRKKSGDGLRLALHITCAFYSTRVRLRRCGTP